MELKEEPLSPEPSTAHLETDVDTVELGLEDVDIDMDEDSPQPSTSQQEDSEIDSPKEKKLKEVIARQSKIIKTQQEKMWRMKKKIAKLSMIIEDLTSNVS